MRKSLLSVSVVLSMLAAGSAVADEPIGPIYKSKKQVLVCMARCESGTTCDFTIRWNDADGAELSSQAFTSVPDNGSRWLEYEGSENPVSCECFDSDCEMSVAMLKKSLKGKVEAYSMPD